MDLAPTCTLRLAPGPPMSVRTQPGQTELMEILRGASSRARIRVREFRATVDTEYAEGQPALLTSPSSRAVRQELTSESSAGRVRDESANRGRRSRPTYESSPSPLETMTTRPPPGMHGRSASVTAPGP